MVFKKVELISKIMSEQLKKYGVRSGLFGQLHYNYNYRLKQALQDHTYTKDCLYDEDILKPAVDTGDAWHIPLVSFDNDNCDLDVKEDSQQVSTESESAALQQLLPCDMAENNKTMYEHDTVNVYVKQLEGIIKVVKSNVVSSNPPKNMAKDSKKDRQLQKPELSISLPPMKEVKPFGFNYHNVKQNSQEWLNLRTGRVTCSVIGYLIGLGGQKEHLHYLGCIKNKLDPNKVRPKKFASFIRGQQFESEAVKAFVDTTKIPINSCGFFTHPHYKRFGGSPDGVGPGFLLEVKTRVSGSDGPLLNITGCHLLQTNFQMVITGATITFLQSYHPETKKFNLFLIEKDNLLVTVIKTVLDHMIMDNCIDEWHHDENEFLKKFGIVIIGKVPNFENMKPLRSCVNEEARNITKVNVTSM